MVGAVLVFSSAAYFVQQSIVGFLLKPAHHQQFIYTSPGGGIGFLFQVCLYAGIVAAIPITVYELLRFIEPVIDRTTRHFAVRCASVSALLATVGFGFGYVIGLPAALHFLGHQFTTQQIRPLLTIQEYMSFITIYLVGSALLFQLPLIVLLINRIKPQPPGRLLSGERYVIAGAFIVSMLMAPTVNVVDQLIIAGPIIAMYQVAIAFAWLQNRRRPTKDRKATCDPTPDTSPVEPQLIQQQLLPATPPSPQFSRQPPRPRVMDFYLVRPSLLTDTSYPQPSD